MNNWQYRIIHSDGNYAIYTVYYTDAGELDYYDPDPVTPSTSDLDSLSHQMIHMMSAFTQPVLEKTQFEYNTAGSLDAAMELMRSRK